MKPKILITGANGFIGGFIVLEALSEGFDVYSCVRKNSNVQSLKSLNTTIVEVNYTDVTAMASLIREHRFDYIIHNAGLTKSPDPGELIRINKGLLEKLVEAIRISETKIKKLIYISSLAAYGPADHSVDGIVRDSCEPSPVTHYGKSKLAAELYLKQQTDIPYIILRPTVVYGPREKDLLNVFQMINKRIDVQPGLISQKLTFIYVKDLAKLILKACMSDKVHKGYFATDGNVYTSEAFAGFIKEYMNKWALKVRVPIFLVQGLAHITEKLAGLWDSYPVFNVDKVNELKAKNWNCDVSNLYHDLGFKAEYDLTKGIPETIQWYKENKWL
jgi:nucleoside-diphosphate-sugar epimerase